MVSAQTNALRGRWGVENRLHLRLDVIFGEDVSHIRKGNAPATITAIRHLALNLFAQEPYTLRLSQKRRKATYKATCEDDCRANMVFCRGLMRARTDPDVVNLASSS